LAISSFARASKILKGEAEGTKFYFPVVGTEVSFPRTNIALMMMNGYQYLKR